MPQDNLKNLIIITPTAPPEVCGVSDYAFALQRELITHYKSVQFGVQRIPTNYECSLQVISKKWEEYVIKAINKATPNDLILNYTPLSYNYFGFPKKLITLLKEFKAAHLCNRIFLIAHEVWNGNPNLKIHHKIKDRISKWSLKQIVELADGVLTMTQEQQQKLTNLSSKPNIHLGFVGSNILPNSQTLGLNSVRKKGQWVVFGLAHTRLWALQANLNLLKELYQRGILKTIRTVGPVDNEYGEKEKTFSIEHFGKDFLDQLGVLASDKISYELLTAEASITGQTSDSLRKSGTFAALAAHAVPVIHDTANNITDPPIEALFHSNEILTNAEIFSSEEGYKKQRILHSWFWDTRSWKVIADDVYKWMNEAK